MVNGWKIEVIKNMPQKVATAMAKVSDTIIGTEYDPICYIGSQIVNGVNHAVLAEQIVVTGRDTKNIVVMIFNERPNSMECSLVAIERVVEGGLPFGGVKIDVKMGDEIPSDVMDVWNDAFKNFVGSEINPVAYVGSQIVTDANYFFVATIKPVSPDATEKVVIVTINSAYGTVGFQDILENRHESSLRYAFTFF